MTLGRIIGQADAAVAEACSACPSNRCMWLQSKTRLTQSIRTPQANPPDACRKRLDFSEVPNHGQGLPSEDVP